MTEILPHAPAQSGQFVRHAEWLFAVVGLLFMIGVPRIFLTGLSLADYSIASAIEGNPRVQATMTAIYAVTALLIYHKVHRAIKLFNANSVFVVFLLILFLSPIWADIPSLSFRRTIALFGNTLFAVFLVVRFSPGQFLNLLGWALGITLALNLAAIVVLPNIAIAPYAGGALRGLHGHKNGFGQIMVLTAIVFWLLRSRTGWRGVFAWCAFVMSVALAAFSRSGSALAVLFGLFCVAVPLIHTLRNRTLSPSLRLLWVLIVGVGGFVFLLANFYGAGLELIGKDVTLTNRTKIWDLVVDQGWKSPWLGSGYGSFWEGSTGKVFAERWSEIGHAHNGFIEIWLSLGFVGLAVFVSVLIRTGLKVVVDVLKTGDEFAIFMAMFLLYTVAYMTVAKMLPDHRSVPWVIFVCVVLYSRIRSSLPKSRLLKGPAPEGAYVPVAAE